MIVFFYYLMNSDYSGDIIQPRWWPG